MATYGSIYRCTATLLTAYGLGRTAYGNTTVHQHTWQYASTASAGLSRVADGLRPAGTASTGRYAAGRKAGRRRAHVVFSSGSTPDVQVRSSRPTAPFASARFRPLVRRNMNALLLVHCSVECTWQPVAAAGGAKASPSPVVRCTAAGNGQSAGVYPPACVPPPIDRIL